MACTRWTALDAIEHGWCGEVMAKVVLVLASASPRSDDISCLTSICKKFFLAQIVYWLNKPILLSLEAIDGMRLRKNNRQAAKLGCDIDVVSIKSRTRCFAAMGIHFPCRDTATSFRRSTMVESEIDYFLRHQSSGKFPRPVLDSLPSQFTFGRINVKLLICFSLRTTHDSHAFPQCMPMHFPAQLFE